MAEVAALARPRYHFAGTKNTFYARPPYTNPDLGAGTHVTRFIGLAAVGNVAKQKSLHALGLVPAADMDVEALQQKPEVRSSPSHCQSMRHLHICHIGVGRSSCAVSSGANGLSNTTWYTLNAALR